MCARAQAIIPGLIRRINILEGEKRDGEEMERLAVGEGEKKSGCSKALLLLLCTWFIIVLYCLSS